jgi:hypothetical protein
VWVKRNSFSAILNLLLFIDKYLILRQVLLGICSVTYSGVLFTMELYCNSKSQHTTVKHSQQLFKHMYTSNLYGLGTLTPIEFVQQDHFRSSSKTNWLSKPIQSHIQQNSLLWKSITACLRCCVTVELRPSSIVASLRRCNNVVPVHCYVTAPTSRYGNHNMQK